MHPFARWKLLVAVLVAAGVLVVLLVRLHRAPSSTDPVITHEVRDLVATLQEPLEVPDATPGVAMESRGTWTRVVACLGVLGLGVLAWMRGRRDTSGQTRERNSSS